MDVLIVGAGAVGSLLAFELSAAGHRVTTVGRPAHKRAVDARGVFLDCGGRACGVDGVRAVESTEPLSDDRFDLVLITTKAFDTAVAAVQALPFVQRGAAALVMQNGVGGVDIARGILGAHNLYAGVITIAVELPKPAVVRADLKKGGIGVAPANSQDAAFLADLFSQAGFKTRLYADWRTIKWSKLLLNILANAIPAILDWPPDKVYANRKLYELELGALREACVVIRRMRVRLSPLPGYRVPMLTWVLRRFPPRLTQVVFRRVVVGARGEKRPSLHIDLGKGRAKSEVEFLNGAVVRAGARLGVSMPVNRMLSDVLLGIAQGRIEWNEYRGQPDRLINRARSKREADAG